MLQLAISLLFALGDFKVHVFTRQRLKMLLLLRTCLRAVESCTGRNKGRCLRGKQVIKM